jgi:hypothetical protein
MFGERALTVAGDVALIVRFKTWPAIIPDGLNPVTVKPSVMVMLTNVAFISPVFWIGMVSVIGLDGATVYDPSGGTAEIFGPFVTVKFNEFPIVRGKYEVMYTESLVGPSVSLVRMKNAHPETVAFV